MKTASARLAAVALAAHLTVPSSAQCGIEVEHAMLDAGVPGPRLTTPEGAAVLGSAYSVQVVDALPFSLGVMLFGGFENAVFDPLTLATIHVGSPFKLRLFATNADGRSQKLLRASSLDGELCGIAVLYQAALFDAMSTGGFAVTNAVRIRIGEVTEPIYGPEVRPFVKQTAIAVVDMDEDGIRDLVSVGIAPDGYAFQQGLASGGFAPAAVQNVPTFQPRGIELGDIDGDGVVDIVTANTLGGNDFSVLLGVGDGSVVSNGNIAGPAQLERAALADLNQDGALDVVMAHRSDNSLRLRLGNGDGTFELGQLVDVGSVQRDVEVADLDVDGVPDLVATLQTTQSVGIRLGTGGGAFEPVAAYPVLTLPGFPVAVEIADLNADGVPDVVTATPGQNRISIQRGAGDGTLLAPVHRATGFGPDDLILSDIDGDSVLDALTIPGLGEVSLLVGNGNGSFFPAQRFQAGYGPVAAAITDVDLDGANDALVVGTAFQPELTTLWGNDAGSFDAAFHITDVPVPTLPRIADVNGDGFNDVVGFEPNMSFPQLGDPTFVVLLGSPTGFGAPIETPFLGIPGRPIVGDVTGDGVPDLVHATPSNIPGAETYVHVGNGDGTFGPPVASPAGYESAELADLNGDGRMDLVCTSTLTPGGQVLVRLGTATGQFSGFTGYLVGDRAIAIGDVDEDGNLDIVSGDNEAIVLLGTGTGAFLPQAAFATVGVFFRVRLADVDADGHLDALFSKGNGFLEVYLGDGAGGFAAPLVLALTLEESEEFHVDDFDGDGVLDVLGPRDTGGTSGQKTMVLFSGAGDGTFAETFAVPAGFNFAGSAVGNLDDDGILDLVVAGGAAPIGFSRLIVYLNLIGE